MTNNNRRPKVIELPVIQQNASGISPTEFNVLMKPDKVEEITRGGIIKPHTHVEADQHASIEGILIAVSPLAFTFEAWPPGSKKPKPGDRIIIAKYSGSIVKGDDEEDYRLIKDKDILAIKES